MKGEEMARAKRKAGSDVDQEIEVAEDGPNTEEVGQVPSIGPHQDERGWYCQGATKRRYFDHTSEVDRLRAYKLALRG